MKTIILALAMTLSLNSFAKTVKKAMPASIYFENIKEGQTLENGTIIKFGVKNMKLHPAGEIIPGTGHHHLIINGGPIPKGQMVIADATHIHFGKAQTETKLELPAGDYTLTLQFADGAHLSYGPELSSSVKVHVK